MRLPGTCIGILRVFVSLVWWCVVVEVGRRCELRRGSGSLVRRIDNGRQILVSVFEEIIVYFSSLFTSLKMCFFRAFA
jgi:hypothetical protein